MALSGSVQTVWAPRMLSVLRVMTSALYIEHGSTKLLGFPGPMPAAHPLFPVLSGGIIEAVGGVLLLLGLFSRPVAFIMAGEMAVAYFYAHFPRAFFPYNNGGALAIMYCFVFFYVFLAGPGPWSIDALRRKA